MNELHFADCLQMAMQSLVTDVSGWVRRPLEVHEVPGTSQATVVPDVFS